MAKTKGKGGNSHQRRTARRRGEMARLRAEVHELRATLADRPVGLVAAAPAFMPTRATKVTDEPSDRTRLIAAFAAGALVVIVVALAVLMALPAHAPAVATPAPTVAPTLPAHIELGPGERTEIEVGSDAELDATIEPGGDLDATIKPGGNATINNGGTVTVIETSPFATTEIIPFVAPTVMAKNSAANCRTASTTNAAVLAVLTQTEIGQLLGWEKNTAGFWWAKVKILGPHGSFTVCFAWEDGITVIP